MTTHTRPKGVNWMVGGPQGSGVDSAAQLFALAVARAGLHVVGQREYYSNIMGKHSYFKIRAADVPIRTYAEVVHMLATYEEETLIRHLHSGEVTKGGAVLYMAGTEDVPVDRPPNLDRRVKEEVAKELEAHGLDATVGGALELAKKRGIHVLPLDYETILEEVAEELDLPKGLKILRNTCAVGASLGLMGLPPDHLDDTVRYVFARKSEKVHDMNILAARKAAKRAQEELGDRYTHRLPAGEPDPDRVWITGTQAVALGKIAAGCRFHTYYPISPATDEATFLESHPDSGVVVVQTEDEIAAVTMAAGASLTGARAGTSTSGPGFNLMVEGLGWASMCEAPLVVVDYMRGGPSTGLPTRTEQGDLQFALRWGHSDGPRIVVAPGDVEEMFYDTVRAYEWADRYQCPVIVIPDKAMAGNGITLAPFPLDDVTLDRGRIATEEDLRQKGADGKFPRFHASEDGVSTRTLLGQRDGIHWLTGDEHTRMGHITEDPVIRDQMMAKRLRKVEKADLEIPGHIKATLHGPAEADLTIVAWGGTKGSILEAMEDLGEAGITVNFLQYRVMRPFPAETEAILQSAKRLLCIEENATGQLQDLVAERTGIRIPHHARKTNGRPLMPSEVEKAVHQVMNDDAPQVVMRHGV